MGTFKLQISNKRSSIGLFIAILLINILSISIFAETNPKDSLDRKIAELKAKALKYDRQKDVYNAIVFYEQYLAYKNKDYKTTWRLASLLFETRDYPSANRFYDTLITNNSKKYPLSYYYKGLVCMNLQKYDDAVEAFTTFRKAYKKNDDKYDYRKLAATNIESCGWAKENGANTGSVEIIHLGGSLNHSNIDFSPYPIDDNSILYGAVYSDTSKKITPVRQIFKAVKHNGQWKCLGLIDTTINNPDFNTGNAVISEDGERMYFTRSRKNWQNVDICEIFVSTYDGYSWSIPTKLPYPVNDENYTSTQPAIGKNLKTGNEILYFVSNREGGKGGLDIWFTEFNKKTNTYKEPDVLDKNINTIGDECCPFYDIASRTLYFSSNGKANCLGGYDIYKATGSSRKWTEAEHLPVPYNSSYDDYYFSILKNDKEGYFTSNRPGSFTNGSGSCCDDIYSFKVNDCVRINSFGEVRNSANYDFFIRLNAKYNLGIQLPENNIALTNVPIELYLPGQKESDNILIAKTTTDNQGYYHFELERNKTYKILVKNYGYFEKSFSVNTVNSNCSDTINIGTTKINYLPKVNNARVSIYYEYDNDNLSVQSKRTIDSTLMPLFDLFPNAILEIGSHTDSTGTDQYNLDLSQRRSDNVVNYLISKGIAKERLVAKGYGMSMPIARNTNDDGSDNPDGRQQNRRTEIKIVGELSTADAND